VISVPSVSGPACAPGGPAKAEPGALTPGQRRRRRRLDAISVLQDSTASGATTIARKRSVFANVLGYAIELEELTANPLDRLSWRCSPGLPRMKTMLVLNSKVAQLMSSRY
jgi:hypothetical protein